MSDSPMQQQFVPFPKIPRLNRPIVVTEKIDGTNACIEVSEDGRVQACSRTRYITPDRDNFGFARWVADHAEELQQLGPGRHFGEWWGQGIQRGYGLKEKRFSLFNTSKWTPATPPPACCRVVPVLFEMVTLHTPTLDIIVKELATSGSRAEPGFMRPEGIVIFHTAASQYFKVTIENDTEPKGRHQEG